MVGSLSEKLYEGSFPMRVEHVNDSYGHLHHDAYFVYVDVVTDRFLSLLGFSHEILIEKMGVCLVKHSGRDKYHKELRQFDKFDVAFEVCSRGETFLDFVYKFLKSEDEKGVVAFKYDSTWTFVDAKIRKPIPIPNFFLDALRNAKG